MRDARNCPKGFRYENQRLAQLARQQRAAEGQHGGRVEHCKLCSGWHLSRPDRRHG